MDFIVARFPREDSQLALMRAIEYLRTAFKQGPLLTYVLSPDPSTGSELSPAEKEAAVGSSIDEKRSVWASEPFPELMRLRDYFSFMEFARETSTLVVVCGANPYAGRFVGEKGTRCYDGNLFVVSRLTPPNEGLLAADPADVRLAAGLAALTPPLSYAEYVERLRTEGLRVLEARDGYVVEDSLGHRLYQGYRLHGVYDADSLESAWTARRGQRLRGALNRRLGEELVRFGPQDDWAHRNDTSVAGPLQGPQPPVILFGPRDDFWNYVSADDMASSCPPYRRHWARLYPATANTPQSTQGS